MNESDVVGDVEIAAAVHAPRRAAPSAVGGESQRGQRAVRARSIRNLQLLIPLVIRIARVGGRQPLALLLIADAERIDYPRADGMVPGAAPRSAAVKIGCSSLPCLVGKVICAVEVS